MPTDPKPNLASELFDLGCAINKTLAQQVPPPKPKTDIEDTSQWDREYLAKYYDRPGQYSGD